MRAYFSTQVGNRIVYACSDQLKYKTVYFCAKVSFSLLLILLFQVGDSLPEEMWTQLGQLERRIGLFEDDVETEE